MASHIRLHGAEPSHRSTMSGDGIAGPWSWHKDLSLMNAMVVSGICLGVSHAGYTPMKGLQRRTHSSLCQVEATVRYLSVS